MEKAPAVPLIGKQAVHPPTFLDIERLEVVHPAGFADARCLVVVQRAGFLDAGRLVVVYLPAFLGTKGLNLVHPTAFCDAGSTAQTVWTVPAARRSLPAPAGRCWTAICSSRFRQYAFASVGRPRHASVAAALYS